MYNMYIRNIYIYSYFTVKCSGILCHETDRSTGIRSPREELPKVRVVNLNSNGSLAKDVDIGVSLNGGTPHFTPQWLIIFYSENPWVCWGNPPF